MPTSGYVYMLHGQGTSYVKIGKTTNPFKRFDALQNAVPFTLQLMSVTLVHNMDLEEEVLLRRYAAYKVRGEWFAFPPALLSEWPLDTSAKPLLTLVQDLEVQERPMNHEAAMVLTVLHKHGPLSIPDIIHAMGLPAHEYHRMRQVIHRLYADNHLGRKTRGMYYAMPSAEQESA